MISRWQENGQKTRGRRRRFRIQNEPALSPPSTAFAASGADPGKTPPHSAVLTTIPSPTPPRPSPGTQAREHTHQAKSTDNNRTRAGSNIRIGGWGTEVAAAAQEKGIGGWGTEELGSVEYGGGFILMGRDYSRRISDGWSEIVGLFWLRRALLRSYSA